jgi:SAM-dependent methyltransferase
MPAFRPAAPRLADRLLVGGTAAAVLGAAAAAWMLAWGAFVAAALAGAAGGAALWARDVLTTRQVVAGAILLRLACLPLPPTLSDDAYRYVWDGLVQTEAGVSPYRYRPSDAALAEWHDTTVYARLNSADFYSVYPPVSQLVFRAGGAVYGAWGWEGSYYVIKALLAALEVAGVVVLARMLPARALVLYAWHPLAVIETAGQGHTEAAAVGLLALAWWGARRAEGGRRGALLAGAAWAGATLVKLVPAMLCPFLQSKKWIAWSTGTAVAGLLTLPYLDPTAPAHVKASLDLYVRYFEFNAGPYFAAKRVLGWWTGADWSKVLGPAFRWAFVASWAALAAWAWRRGWPFRRAAAWTFGLYLACSTTVHPWYLLLLLPFVAGGERRAPAWGWWWLAGVAAATYLRYAPTPHAEAAYGAAVALGWTGGAALLAWQYGPHTLRRALAAVQWRRAATKARRLRPHLAPVASGGHRPRILDLGAGEGYVGARLARTLGADVTLCDVLDFRATPGKDLPFVRYDGHTLPFADETFDACILYFVLHHAADPARVLAEAVRVTRGRVVVVESVVTGPVQARVLGVLDRLANRLRSGGAMAGQEEHLTFRPTADWLAAAQRLGRALHVETHGRWPHPQALLVIEPNKPLLQAKK